MEKTPIAFKLISLKDVPFRPPVVKLVDNQTGSQWDRVLDALLKHPDKAVSILEKDTRTRSRLKSTLQTIAKNRGLFVEVFAEGDYIYAWVGKREGRYMPVLSTR